MKHLFIVLLFALVLSNLNAQDESSGNWLLGGSVSYSHQNQDDYYSSFVGGIFYTDRKITQLNLRPYLGKQLNDRWMVGLTPTYSLRSTIYEGMTDTGVELEKSKGTTNTFGGSIFARYVVNPSNLINIFLRPNFLYNVGNSKTERDGQILSKSQITNWSTGIGFGLSYNISDQFNIIGTIGGLTYTSTIRKNKLNNEEDRNDTRFGISINSNSTYFGFEYKL